MLKGIFFTFICCLFAGVAAYASSDVEMAINYGKEKPKGISIENKFSKSLNSFSLRSNMQFRGEKIIDNAETTNNHVNINFVILYPKNKTSYTITNSKKNSIISRVTFNPNETVKDFITK